MLEALKACLQFFHLKGNAMSVQYPGSPEQLQPTRTNLNLGEPQFSANPLVSHIRQLRDLALYMVESHEEGHTGHSGAIKAILTTRPTLWSEVRMKAITIMKGDPKSPVEDVARSLSTIDALTTAFPADQVCDGLLAACLPFVERPKLPLEAEDKRRRSYIRLVRYLEQRIVDGANPTTLAFICFPIDVPTRIGSLLAEVGGKVHHEHVVPRLLLANRCTKMLRAGEPLEKVARWVEPYVAVVKITPAEAKRLDQDMRLKTAMPANWEFGSGCIYDRLHEGEITFSLGDGSGCCVKTKSQQAAVSQ